MNFNEMREQLAAKVSETLQLSMSAIISQGNGPQDCVHLGCNTALSSLITVLPLLSSKTFKSEEDVVQAMNYETLLFAALIVVKMHGDLQITKKRITSEDGRIGFEVNQEVNFGPSIMAEALQDWKTLTNKDPAKYFNKTLLKAVAHSEAESKSPFDEFLKKRINGPTSSTLN